MTLRTRLVIGYGYLVVLLVITAVSATAGFFGLSKGIDRILEENFASIRSSTQMVEALERQDSATFKILLGQEDGRTDLERADQEFLDALGAAKGNITVSTETGLIEEADEQFEEYREVRDRLIAASPERPLQRYNRDVFPLFVDVKSTVLELLDVNHEAMIEADEQARSAATRNGVWLGILVALGVLSFVLLTRALQNQLLSRLAKFEEISEAVASGDEFQRLPEDRDDELGVIGRHFNAAVDRLEQLRGNARGRLAEQRGLIVALMRELSSAEVLMGLDGSPIVQEAAVSEVLASPRAVELVKEHLREQFRDGVEQTVVNISDSEAIEFELLSTRGGRPLGWLGHKLDKAPESATEIRNPDAPT
ncbi:MAG: HAMP domain-containing protein [Myxococcota bacterium]